MNISTVLNDYIQEVISYCKERYNGVNVEMLTDKKQSLIGYKIVFEGFWIDMYCVKADTDTSKTGCTAVYVDIKPNCNNPIAKNIAFSDTCFYTYSVKMFHQYRRGIYRKEGSPLGRATDFESFTDTKNVYTRKTYKEKFYNVIESVELRYQHVLREYNKENEEKENEMIRTQNNDTNAQLALLDSDVLGMKAEITDVSPSGFMLLYDTYKFEGISEIYVDYNSNDDEYRILITATSYSHNICADSQATYISEKLTTNMFVAIGKKFNYKGLVTFKTTVEFSCKTLKETTTLLENILTEFNKRINCYIETCNHLIDE